MSWEAQSGNVYNLCLLDTNALSEITKRPKVEGRGFIERFPPDSYAPCFTVYNLIELRRKRTLFKGFLKVFSTYLSCFLLKPHEMIRDEERNASGNPKLVSPLMNAFSIFGQDSSYKLTDFSNKLFSTDLMKKIEKNWRNDEAKILKAWLSEKGNFHPKRSVPNALDAENYVDEAGLQSLISTYPNWAKIEIASDRIPDINAFPSIILILYSKYYRLYDPHWKPKPQDITDIIIMSAAPYMEVVVTEAFQAEILKKVKKKVEGLDKVEIETLKGIRYNKKS